MVFRKTYKSYSQLKTFIYIVPSLRILKFKRTKWKSLQKNLKFFFSFLLFRKRKKSISDTSKFPNNFLYIYSFVKENRVKSFYKISIELKNSIYAFFNQKVSTGYYKKILKKKLDDRKQLFLEILIKPFFQLEILLWKLSLFKTISEIKQALVYKQIKINNFFILNNIVLKKGDIISLVQNKLMKSKKMPTFLWSFVEIDYYSNTIIIIKDLTEFDVSIIPILIPEIINLGLLIDYIKNK